MKKEFEIKKFNVKKRTIINIINKSQCNINGKLVPQTTDTTLPTITGIFN